MDNQRIWFLTDACGKLVRNRCDSLANTALKLFKH